MIFVDSNIPMYLIGSAHPNKDRAIALCERQVVAGERLVTDAEAFQEILHRYAAIGRLDAVDPAFAALAELVDEVFPIDLDVVMEARAVLLGHGGALSARDAIHVAVMRREGIARILSFDRGFDAVPGVERLA